MEMFSNERWTARQQKNIAEQKVGNTQFYIYFITIIKTTKTAFLTSQGH